MKIQKFEFEGLHVRIVSKAGEPVWFIAAEVTRALDITNSSTALESLDCDEVSHLSILDSPGKQLRKTTVINESGLYSLIFKSRKPAAKRFKKWVTSEVLPSLRKNGEYTIAGKQPSFAQVRAETRLYMSWIAELDALGARKQPASLNIPATNEMLDVLETIWGGPHKTEEGLHKDKNIVLECGILREQRLIAVELREKTPSGEALVELVKIGRSAL